MLPPPVAAMLLAVKAPPARRGGVGWAVKLALAPVRPALLVAVTAPVPVGEAAVKV